MSGSVDITRRTVVALIMIGSMVLFSQTVGVSSPWFAITAAFILLGIFDLFRPYLSLPLPGPLLKTSAWEERGAVSRRIGVIAFGRFLQRSPLRHLNKTVYLPFNSGDLDGLRCNLDWAVAAHFWAAFLTIPYLAFAVAHGWWNVFVALLAFDVAVNVYPILHLRLVRIRLDRASHRQRRGQNLKGIEADQTQPPTQL